MKKIILKSYNYLFLSRLFFCIALFPLLTYAEQATINHNASSNIKNILIYGDSLSAGYGLQTGEEWPALLQQQIDKQAFAIINASVSGETSKAGKNRFAKTFQRYQPALVILELGANDGLRGQSLTAMESNLDTMITYSLNHQASVILAGVHIPPNYGQRYSAAFYQVFERLKDRHAISFIPFLLDGIATDQRYKQNDGLHPNAEAQTIIVDNVLSILTPLLQSL